MNFETMGDGEMDILGTIYQTRGIMHYTNNNAAKAGTQTLLTWDGSLLRTTNMDDDNVLEMQMTPLDIYRVNKLYQCDDELESKS